MKTLRIATRQSPLALWQAHFIKQKLHLAHPELHIEICGMTTTGDKLQKGPLHQSGGKRLFVKELEQALLAGKADIAVHSMKDVPLDFPEGLGLSAICEREDPRDAFLSAQYAALTELPPGAVVGTASLRRTSQLLALHPLLNIQPLRGNIDTRLRQMEEGRYAAIILAAAGLIRLGLQTKIKSYFSPEEFIPAAGQGALGIECRVDDHETLKCIRVLDHPATHRCVTAERALSHHLQGGCQVPIGAYAINEGDQLVLHAIVASPDGQMILRAQASGPHSDPEKLGIEVAEILIAQGAEKILQGIAEQNNGFGV